MKKAVQIIKQKARSRAGFTLAESLTAVLIMLMVSSIVVAGIPAAKNAYDKVVLASNAEVLLSSTVTALRNELGIAGDISIGSPGGTSGTDITYRSQSTGSYSRIYLGSGGATDPAGTIMLQRYASSEGLGMEGESTRLISRAASTENLYVTFRSASYQPEAGIVTFTGLEVINRITGQAITSRDHLSVRSILA